MIAMLRGRLLSAGLGQVIVEAGGVGYRVWIPPGASFGAPGDEVVVYTHLAVREDAMTLYGFVDAATRDLFETLLAVSGVGPKLALAALGTLGADGLRRAVVSEDVAALTVVPGVGKKGAQRMILELRERLGALRPEAAVPGPAAAGADARSEVREALAALGYAPGEVQQTMDILPEDAPETPDELLRLALRSLGSH